MAIDVKLKSPDNATEITLKASKVTQAMTREPRVRNNPNNKVVLTDLEKMRKQFTIIANLHDEATGGLDKTEYEQLEDACHTWSKQTTNSGRTLFTYSTKQDAANKTYRVTFMSVTLLEDVETAPQVYKATIILAETPISPNSYSVSGGAA